MINWFQDNKNLRGSHKVLNSTVELPDKAPMDIYAICWKTKE
jgi:hypothetical protein